MFILRRRLLPLGPTLHDGDHHRRVHRPHLHHHLWFYYRLQRQKQVLGVSDRSDSSALCAVKVCALVLVVLVIMCLFFPSRKFSAVKNQQESLSTSGPAAGHRPSERQAERTDVTVSIMSQNRLLDSKVTTCFLRRGKDNDFVLFRTMSVIDSLFQYLLV